MLKDDPTGQGPVGFQPLFDSSIVEYQVSIVRNMGAEKIVFLSSTISGSLLQYVDSLNQQNIAAEIIRSGQELVAHASSDGQFIYLGDGILPDATIVERLSGTLGELIYVVGNADEYTDFERVDLTHRWLGIAVLKTSHLVDLADIPDDWDIGSALLRTSVQAQVHREIVTDEQMASGAIVLLKNEVAIEQFTERKLAAPSLRTGNIVDRFLVWPLARRSLRPLWRHRNVRRYINGAAVVSGVLASVTAFFQWPVPTLGLLFVGFLAGKQSAALQIFSPKTDKFPGLTGIFLILSQIALLILLAGLSTPATIIPNVVIFLALQLNISLVEHTKNRGRLRLFQPDFMMISLILLIGASFGQIFTGLYASLLWTAAYLVADRLLFRSKAEK